MSQMWNTWKRSNVIIIDQTNEFEDQMKSMIVHEHQFSFDIEFCIWMLKIMLQKFQSDFIRRKITVWEHYIRVWWKTFWWKSASHDFLSLNEDHEWRRIIISCIDHFNDDNWFSIIRIDWIKFLDFLRHDDSIFLRTFNAKFTLIKIDEIRSSNLQFSENILIFIKSLSHFWFVDCFISFHEQWLDFNHMQIASLSSFSKSRLRRRWSTLSTFQIHHNTE
jgi:hypothetical protein